MAKHHSHQQTKPRLLDQVRNVLRLEHYSYRREEAYVQWIKRLIVFNGRLCKKSKNLIKCRKKWEKEAKY